MVLEALTHAIVGAVLLGTAAVLLALRPSRPVNRALALFLGARGLLTAASLLALGVGGYAVLGARVVPYFQVGALFAALHFAWVYRRSYPHPRPRSGPWAWAVPAVLLTGAVTLGALYAADHALWSTPRGFGPLSLIATLKLPTYALVALLLARDLRNAARGPAQRSLLVASLAFALDPMFLASRVVAGEAAALLGPGDPRLADPVVAASRVVLLACLGILGLLLATLARWARDEGPAARAAARRYGLALSAPFITALVALAAAWPDPAVLLPLDTALDGAWTLALPVLLGYAILRHQLFDLDLRVKRSIRAGSEPTTFLAVLLVTSQGVQLLLPGPVALAIGLTAAAGLLLVLARLQRLAGRVADAVLPDAVDTPEYVRVRKVEVYRDALEQALAIDGDLAPGEAAMLGALRARLGLSEADHQRLFAEVGAGERSGRLEPGRLALGRYRIVRRLGAGGSGEAWLARDERDGRDVVLKRLLDAGRRDARALQGFHREARLAGALQHPGIVAVHGVEVVGPAAYLVMEYLPGGSLADRLARGRLDEAEAGAVARDVLGGLAALHARGIVHRDVKPGNILLTADGRAKLGDFTIAREEVSGQTEVAGPGQWPLGTPAYLAPEQARGQPATPRSDLYSLGATVYEALAGETPVDLDDLTGHEAIVRLAQGRPRLPLQGVTEAMNAWLARALAKEPEDRFPDAPAMAAALPAPGRAVIRAGTPAGSGRRRPRRPGSTGPARDPPGPS